jgi:hypothetical protein
VNIFQHQIEIEPSPSRSTVAMSQNWSFNFDELLGPKTRFSQTFSQVNSQSFGQQKRGSSIEAASPKFSNVEKGIIILWFEFFLLFINF